MGKELDDGVLDGEVTVGSRWFRGSSNEIILPKKKAS
jgi:hypothetical protein